MVGMCWGTIVIIITIVKVGQVIIIIMITMWALLRRALACKKANIARQVTRKGKRRYLSSQMSWPGLGSFVEERNGEKVAQYLSPLGPSIAVVIILIVMIIVMMIIIKDKWGH